MRVRDLVRAAAPVLTLSLVLAACGDDKDDAATDTTQSAADHGKLCALAKTMFEQEDFPSAAQIKQYTKLAPAELEDAVSIAGPPIIAADGNPAKFFAGIADDDVEAATHEIDAWETENCGIEHDAPTPKEATTIDPDAARVDVTAKEYTFDFDTDVSAGRVSFVMTNAGKETHFMSFTKINDGHTLAEALAYEGGDPEDAGIVSDAGPDSGLAAPGGKDEEVVTGDLEPGSYAMLCFIPGPDGQPHAFKGMAVPFTVS